MKLQKFVLPIWLPALISACTSIGPHEIRMDMPAYGDVLVQSNAEQILRNLVHLRYGQSTAYLKIASINSNYSLSTSLGVNNSWNIGAPGGTPANTSFIQSLGLSGPSTTFSDAPNIFYQPIEDSTFVTMMMQPVSFNHIALLYNGEANYTMLLAKMTFARAGDVDNASAASSSEVEDSPVYADYKFLMNTISSLIRTRRASFHIVTHGDQTGLLLHFNPGTVSSPEALSIKKLLDVGPQYEDIIFMPNPALALHQNANGSFGVESSIFKPDDNLVLVRMRSIAGIMAFLSHAVRVPQSDLNHNYVQVYRDANGNPYNWGKVLDDLLIVYSSDSEPNDAEVKTYVNDHWFYIKKSDNTSKYTFAMLMKLMTLVLGYAQPIGPQVTPILTIPVGAPR